MQTKPMPEIEASDLKAARDYLTSIREEQRKDHPTRIPLEATGHVKLRNGISRARMRSAAKTPA